MSSPAKAPTPSAQNLTKSFSQRSHGQARPATATNPSTPAPVGTPGQHVTPGSTAPFLSPSLSRVGNVGGKTTLGGKTVANKSLAGTGLPAHHVSPAAAQHGSSPAAANMMATPSLGAGLGGTSFDSPNHAALASVGMEPSSSSNQMGASLSGLGLNNLGMQGLGGNMSHIGMMAGLSQGLLGGSSMGMGVGPTKLDDAERRRRLDSVLHMLGEQSGRISQEGLERLARRMGLEMFDEYRDGGRSLVIAGRSMFAVDVLFRPPTSPVVAQTEFQFHGVNETTIADFSPAANILREDLSPPAGTSAINAKLDSFAKNLEMISKMERLSGPGANCFEAISGIHQSLKKLYEHEKALAKTLEASRRDNDTDMEIVCKKSGRPRMNVRRNVGLSIDYWKDQHLLPQNDAMKNDDAMVDDRIGDMNPFTYDINDTRTLHIDVEPYSSHLYPSIRTSSTWLSDSIVKSPGEQPDPDPSETQQADQVIDWQDPPAPSLDNADARPPDARFVAHLDPPAVLPLNVAAQVFGSVGEEVDASQYQLEQTSWESLVLVRHPAMMSRTNTDEAIQSQSYNYVSVGDGGKETYYDTRLYFPRPESARSVHDISFSHPRQLIQLLPILRQYTLLAKLVDSCVAALSTDLDGAAAAVANGLNGDFDPLTTSTANALDPATQLEELNALLDTPPSSVTKSDNQSNQGAPLRTLDLTIGPLTPEPRLTMILPTAIGLMTAHITIRTNADLTLNATGEAMDALLQQVEESERAAKRSRLDAQMTRCLSFSEDLATLAEWIRKKIAGLPRGS